MRPLELRIKGVTRYTEELALDLRDIEPGIVAVTGGNGAGKTTLIESMAPLPLWLELPSYPGKLADSFQPEARDGYVDATIEWAGHEWRHLVQVDPGHSAGRGKVEAFLYRDGQPVPEWPTPGRVRDYGEAIDAIYPPRSLFLAAAFSVQTGRGNWFELDRVERRDLFARLLGLGQLQELATRAREHRKAGETALQSFADEERRIGERRDNQTRLLGERREVDSEIAACREQLAAVDGVHRMALAAHAQAQAEADEAAGELKQAQQRLDELRQRATAATSACEGARRRLDNAKALVELEPDVRKRVARREELLGLQASATARVGELRATYGAAVAKGTHLEQQLGRLNEERQRLRGQLADAETRQTRLTALEELDEERRQVDEAIAKLDAYSAPVEDLAAKVETARKRQAGLERDHDMISDKIDAAERRAEVLHRVPCGGRVLQLDAHPDDPSPEQQTLDCSTCELLTDAQAGASELPQLRRQRDAVGDQIGEAIAGVEDATEALEAARAERQRVDAMITRARELAYVPGALSDLRARMEAEAETTARLEAIGIEIGTLEAEVVTVDEDARRLAAQLETAQQDHDGLEAELRQLWEAPEQLADIERTKALIPEIEEQIAEWTRRAAEANDDAKAIKVPDPDQHRRKSERLAECAAALDAASSDRTAAQAALSAKMQALARIDGRLDEIGDPEADAKDLKRQRAAADARAAAWALLERALGRDGIQALEIDAAGPEVSDLINELLASCFGRRFTCSLRTMQEAGAGRKQREVFELEILDGLRGSTARGADRYSVGERTLISEALKLGLAIFNARRVQHPLRTLWRDECDGPLEPELAQAYPAMLRRAMELGGYDWVYLISHRPTVWQQADTVIHVADGRATVGAA